MSVEFYRGSPGKFDSRTLNRKTLNRWTGRTASCHSFKPRSFKATRSESRVNAVPNLNMPYESFKSQWVGPIFPDLTFEKCP